MKVGEEDSETQLRLLDLASEASEAEGLRQAYEDVTAGRVRPAREFFEAMRKQLGIDR